MIYADGKKYEGEWLNDKRNGTGNLYDPDGLLIENGNWLNGICISNESNVGTT
jgi:hypothetical protein